MKLTVASHYKILEKPCIYVNSWLSLYFIITWNIGFIFTQPVGLRILYFGCIKSTLSNSRSRSCWK